MAEQKIFAGPRIRRIRTGLGITQAAMAEGLGISPSYLNLIERNQRPLTVQIILKMAGVYEIDVQELQGNEDADTLNNLKEAFADPLLESELPGESELVDLTESTPNAASAVVKLYRAYKESQTRLSDLSQLLAKEGLTTSEISARMPLDEVRDVFEKSPACFVALEDTATALLAKIEPGDDLMQSMREFLQREHGVAVRTLPNETMPNWRRRYDRHSQRMFVSERLTRADQTFEIALEIAFLSARQRLDEEAGFLKLSSDEARRIARFELARTLALALMMPYENYLRACRRARYDIDVLAARFNVTFAQAATRLTQLQRTNQKALPVFLMEVDNAGNLLRRSGSNGFPVTRFGGECPKLVVHQAFSAPGELFCERVVTPADAEFITIAKTVNGPLAGFGERPRRTALLVGFDAGDAENIVYGAPSGGVHSVSSGASGMGASSSLLATQIGPSCRLCERQACLSRAQPSLTKPLGLDETVTGISAFDF